jgi:PAS domain S-box-containing protein
MLKIGSYSGVGAASLQTAAVDDDPTRPHEAVHKASALQDAISNSVNFSSIATDECGIIQIFNPRAERMFGYGADEVLNRMSLSELSDPHDLMARAERLSIEFGTAIKPDFEPMVFKASRNTDDIYELTCLRKDGQRFAAIASVTALRDAQERIIGYLLIATDNTDLKHPQRQHARLPGDAHEGMRAKAASFYDRDHQLREVYAAALSVTERKKTEAQLFESEARTRAILAAAVDAIITIDATGTIESLNTATEKLFGYTAQEMVGQNVKMLMPAPYRAEHDAYLHNYTTTGVKKIIGIGRDVVGRRKNGDTFPMELAVSEVQTGGRRLFTGIVRDITERNLIERNRIERSLQEKNIELEHANRIKSEFLRTMSHELRTPLNAIIGFSEVLKDGLLGPMSAVQTEYIGDIFTSGQHLLSLINDILDLSKVEAGMMTLELEPTDLKNLLLSSLSIVKEKAAAQRISLELKADDNLGVPYMDTRKTKQIVYNLLSNAVKFSAAGTSVVLKASRVPRSCVGQLRGTWPTYGFALADNAHDEFLELCVSDRGIGISQLNMKKLFLAFSQIDSSLARKFEGTGLGLAMVKQLTELQGGTVAVASEEGRGAIFVAWLPLRNSAV